MLIRLHFAYLYLNSALIFPPLFEMRTLEEEKKERAVKNDGLPCQQFLSRKLLTLKAFLTLIILQPT